MKRVLRTVAVIATLFVGVVACSDADAPVSEWTSDAAGGASPVERSGCLDDDDCGANFGCFKEKSICVALPADTVSVSIHVDPRDQTGHIPDQFVGALFSSDGVLDLVMAEPVEVTGRVVHSASLGGEWSTGVPGELPSNASEDDSVAFGTLVATANGRIPGSQVRSEAIVSVETDDESGDIVSLPYSLKLLPNITYSVAFIPDENHQYGIPPYYFTLAVSASVERDIVLPPLDSYTFVEGIVRMGSSDLLPVAGAYVSCMVGEESLGTSAITDENGLFDVVLPPDIGNVTFKVAPGRDSPLFPQRSVVFEGGLDGFANEYISAGFLAIDIGEVPQTRTIAVQVLNYATGTEILVPNVRVTANGTPNGGDFSTYGVTDANGIVELKLLEGSYSLTAVPPAGSDFASTSTSLDLLTYKGHAFFLPVKNRAVISGVVLDSVGNAVAQASVLAMTDQNGALVAQDTVQEITFSATTDEFGHFSMAVDPGPYALVIEPLAESGLPKVAHPNIEMFDGAGVTITVPSGVLIRGNLFSASNGLAVSNARMSFYVPLSQSDVDSIWSLLDPSFAYSIQVLAETSTDLNGAFEVVFPSLDQQVPSYGEGTDLTIGVGGTEGFTYGYPDVEYF